MLKKLKDFIIENEIHTIGSLLGLSVFAVYIVDLIFFTAGDDKKVQPSHDVFYYAVWTLLIHFGFIFIKWSWFKLDESNDAEVIKANNEATVLSPKEQLYFAYAKWFLYLFLLVLTALAVFP